MRPSLVYVSSALTPGPGLEPRAWQTGVPGREDSEENLLMLKGEIQPGEEYAFREKRGPGVPLQRVKAIEHVRGNKWKVEWIEPNPGLTEYVKSGQLLVLWKDARRLLKDEQNEERLRRHNLEHGYAKVGAVGDAMFEVFESAHEGLYMDPDSGALVAPKDAIDRLRARAGVSASATSSVSYADRDDRLHIAFEEALELARAFCAREPSTVLAGVEATEQKWSQMATQGESYMLEPLNRSRASWALIRQWAGHDAAVAAREERLKNMERLVWDAVYALQKAGLESEAGRLRRALQSS